MRKLEGSGGVEGIDSLGVDRSICDVALDTLDILKH